MRISDWSSDVCSSDLRLDLLRRGVQLFKIRPRGAIQRFQERCIQRTGRTQAQGGAGEGGIAQHVDGIPCRLRCADPAISPAAAQTFPWRTKPTHRSLITPDAWSTEQNRRASRREKER